MSRLNSTELRRLLSFTSAATLVVATLVAAGLATACTNPGPMATPGDSGTRRGEGGSGGASCDGSPEPFVGSCRVMQTNGLRECDEYRGGWTPAQIQTHCMSKGGGTMTYSSEPCPTTSLVGSCLIGCGTDYTIVDFDYTGSSLTPAQWESSCTTGGVNGQWVPGPSSSPGDGGDAGEGGKGDAPSGDANCPSTPDPIVGTWKITDVTCAGAPAPADIQSVYTAPNSAKYVFTTDTTGSQVSGTASGSCTLTIPLAFSYPSPGTIVVTDDGPLGCSPAGCSPACGISEKEAPKYTYVEKDCNTLVFTSVGMNDVCANPVVYTLQRD